MASTGILGMVAMAALAASTGAARQQNWFACSVSGEKLLAPPMSAKAVCETLHQAVNHAIGTPAVAKPKLSDRDRAHADWVELDIRFSRPGTATARLTQRKGARVTHYPEFAIDVSDRPLDATTVALLSREIEQRIASKS
jgi:hypothetical protein